MNNLSSYQQYMNLVNAYQLLTPEREMELSNIVHNSKDEKEIEKAITELVNCNLRLVVSFAHALLRRFVSIRSDDSMLMDMIEEGNMALMRSARTFDATKGKFSTYAAFQIKTAVKRALSDTINIIHIPDYHYKYWKEIEALKEKYGENVSEELIAEELGISEELVGSLTESKKNSKLTMLDSMEDWSEFVGTVESNEAEIEGRSIVEYMVTVIKKVLNARELKTLMYMHVNDHKPTYTELGAYLGVSKERCRQIYEKALRKVRRSMIKKIEDEAPKEDKEKPDYRNHSAYDGAYWTAWWQKEHDKQKELGRKAMGAILNRR